MQKATLPSLSQPIPNPEKEEFQKKGSTDYGYYLLRTNYKLIKPHSKYAEEGVRPRSPPVQYSLLSDELVEKNRKIPGRFFENTTRVLSNAERRPRHFLERHCTDLSQHNVRGAASSNPYCYVTKDPYNRYPPDEYLTSQYGAYPPWGPEDVNTTGIHVRSHFIAEPAERYSNIDLYRRPPTNQTGAIIFDHGRSGNGYYLQRNQYDNTWFGGNLKLNQTDILKNIEPKPLAQYEAMKTADKMLRRSQSMIWPHSSEYESKYAINSSSNEL